MLMLVLPTPGVGEKVLPQVLEGGIVWTVIPGGKLSIKLVMLTLLGVGLVKLRVMVAGAPDAMLAGDAGTKLLLTPGRPTPSVALAVLPCPPFDDPTGSVVFRKLSSVVVETFCVIVHDPPGSKTPPESPTNDPPDSPPVSVPEEPVVQLGGPAAALFVIPDPDG